jgi:hypothetical protein
MDSIRINKLDVAKNTSEFETYYPLMINGDGWSLAFQSFPEPKVVLTGREPTYEDVGKALTFTHIPILMVDVFLVIIKAEIARRAA